MSNQGDTKPVNPVAADGKYPVEWAVIADASMPAREYIVTELQPQIDTVLIDIVSKFKHVAVNGHVGVPETILKHERGEIWGFKHKVKGDLIRLPCFRHDGRWFITHGFAKVLSKSEWPEQEFDRANEIRLAAIASYEARKKKEQENRTNQRHNQQKGRRHHGK